MPASTPTSRYAGQETGGAVDNITTGTGSSAGTATDVKTGTSTQNSNTSTDTSQNTTSLDAGSLALLKGFIANLTKQASTETATKNADVAGLRDQAAGYSKANAFADAQGLIAQQQRRALEQLLPGINNAAESAGSSGGALRALLLQDAANKASESSSALGVKTATDYGNINTNFNSVIERLLDSSNGSAQVLAQAFNVLKGANTTSTGTSNTSGTQTGTTTQTGTSTDAKTTQQRTAVDYAPFDVKSSVSTSPNYFGPAAAEFDPKTASNALLNAMSTNRAFSEFTF